MDISQKTIIELKALAYDMLAQLEALQKNLNVVNQQISAKVQEAQTAAEKVDKKNGKEVK